MCRLEEDDCFFSRVRSRASSALFPYTTLFRSENVRFKYPDGHTVFEDFTLRLQAGEHVGIVGPSGAGKSTLFALLQRLDRKSTRLNSSHVEISYAVFCLKKKTHATDVHHPPLQ